MIEKRDGQGACPGLKHGEAEAVLMPQDLRLDQRSGLGETGLPEQVRMPQNLRGRTGCRHPALGQNDDRCRKTRNLGHGVADENDRHAALVAQPLDIGKDLGLARIVEGCQRLVHQQELRIGEKRAPDGDALLFAARQRRRSPFEKVADAEKLHDILETRLPLPPRGEPAAEEQVLAHVEMREEASFLEHVADAPPVLGNEDAFLRVDEHPPLHDDAAVIRPHETADGVHDRRLAGSRRTEKCCELSVRLEARLEVEGSLRMPDVDVENHYARTRRRIRRASHSDSQSATTEMTMDTSVRRMAPLSPPGTCV